jgi:hypothetical protein
MVRQNRSTWIIQTPNPDVWSDLGHQYLTADYPHLMVRFTDVLFAPESLLQMIADCLGAELLQPVRFQADCSKAHGSQTDLVHPRSSSMVAGFVQ